MRHLRGTLWLLVLLALTAAVAAPALAQDTEIDWSTGTKSALADTSLIKPRNFWRATGEVVGVNLLIWSFDRYIREGGENPVFRVGFDSWSENLEAGWNWDDNNFATNQFSHPYHGSLYFNAARSNGYNYWESIPFTFAGSWMWEYLHEVHHPSLNDWVATSIGGTFLGEVFHRLSATIWDNTDTGGSRNWREVGGFLVNPMGGVNRMIDGDWGRQFANPEDRLPKNFRSRMDIGLRTRGENQIWETDTTDVFIEFDFEYGDMFFGDMGKPFSSFDFQMQMNFGDKTAIGRIEGSGNLAGMFLKETPSASHILGAFHRYDYVNTNAIEFGAQIILAGLHSRFETDAGVELRTKVELGPILLGGSSSDYLSVSGRSYDYGPGTAARFVAAFRRGGWDYLRASHGQYWIHSISGNRADHHLSITKLRLAVPIKYNIGISGEYILYLADRIYEAYPDVSQRTPQTKLAISWILN